MNPIISEKNYQSDEKTFLFFLKCLAKYDSNQLFIKGGTRQFEWLCNKFYKINLGLTKSKIFKNKFVLLIGICGIFFMNQYIKAEDGVNSIKVLREGPPPLEVPEYLDLGTFVVNMPGDKYFLKSSIQLAFENGEAREWMLERMPIVKDLVITHLYSITVDQFDETKNRVVIKRDLQKRLNSIFPNRNIWNDKRPIKRILFLEFYRQ